MKYSKSSYIKALQKLAALRDSVPEGERFAIEFISEAVWNGSAHAFQWLNQPIEDSAHE